MIIYDFKPTEYLQAVVPSAALSVITGDGNTPRSSFVSIGFLFPKIFLAHGFCDDDNLAQFQPVIESIQLPKVGEWTRIEIGHEKVDEKYFLSLSIGGREVGREEINHPELR